MRVLALVLLSLASACAFMPAAMPMPLQQRQASATQGPQMKALNKPARLAEVRRKYNKNHKSEMRTYIKKALRPPISSFCPLPHPAAPAADRSLWLARRRAAVALPLSAPAT